MKRIYTNNRVDICMIFYLITFTKKYAWTEWKILKKIKQINSCLAVLRKLHEWQEQKAQMSQYLLKSSNKNVPQTSHARVKKRKEKPDNNYLWPISIISHDAYNILSYSQPFHISNIFVPVHTHTIKKRFNAHTSNFQRILCTSLIVALTGTPSTAAPFIQPSLRT